MFTGRRRVFAAIANGTKPVSDLTTSLVLSSGTKLPSVGVVGPGSLDAIKAGVRHVRIENDDWEAVKQLIEGGVSRDQLLLSAVISSEHLQNNAAPMAIDLLLLSAHDDMLWVEAEWAAMEQLVKDGKVKHIGLAGFTKE